MSTATSSSTRARPAPGSGELVARTAATLLATLLALVGWATIDARTSPATAQAACDGVWVVVDARALGGQLSTRCAAGDPPNGIVALQQAGFTTTFVPNIPGFVCTIDRRPDPCNMAPGDAYWSYWHAPAGGTWSYSSAGAGNRNPAPGTVEGWRFGDGSSPPGVAPPAAPAPEPPPPADDAGSSDDTGGSSSTGGDTTSSEDSPSGSASPDGSNGSDGDSGRTTDSGTTSSSGGSGAPDSASGSNLGAAEVDDTDRDVDAGDPDDDAGDTGVDAGDTGDDAGEARDPVDDPRSSTDDDPDLPDGDTDGTDVEPDTAAENDAGGNDADGTTDAQALRNEAADGGVPGILFVLVLLGTLGAISWWQRHARRTA